MYTCIRVMLLLFLPYINLLQNVSRNLSRIMKFPENSTGGSGVLFCAGQTDAQI